MYRKGKLILCRARRFLSYRFSYRSLLWLCPLPSARFPLAGKQAGSHKASRDSALHIAESQNHSGSVHDLAMAVTRAKHHNWRSTELEMWLKMWPIGNEETMIQYIYHFASLAAAAAAGSHPWPAFHRRLQRVAGQWRHARPPVQSAVSEVLTPLVAPEQQAQDR